MNSSLIILRNSFHKTLDPEIVKNNIPVEAGMGKKTTVFPREAQFFKCLSFINRKLLLKIS